MFGIMRIRVATAMKIADWHINTLAGKLATSLEGATEDVEGFTRLLKIWNETKRVLTETTAETLADVELEDDAWDEFRDGVYSGEFNEIIGDEMKSPLELLEKHVLEVAELADDVAPGLVQHGKLVAASRSYRELLHEILNDAVETFQLGGSSYTLTRDGVEEPARRCQKIEELNHE